MTHPSLSVARSLLNASNPAGAIQEVRKVFADDPNSIEGGILLARAYLAQGKCAESEVAIRDVLKQDSENMRALAVLASTYSLRRKFKQGLPIAADMIRIDPNDPLSFLTRAIFFEQKEKYRLAEADFQRAMALDPKGTTNTRSLYADFLLQRGRVNEAARISEELTAEDAGHVEAAILRGNIALREGRAANALEDALWALTQEAENRQALDLLVNIKMKTKPFMGLWWRYAAWIGRFSNWKSRVIRVGMLIGLWLVLAFSGPLAPIFAFAWLWFVIASWIGPPMMRRMLAKELKSVQVKPF
jgi:Tfp pilus assembly protein PilF